MKNAYLAWHNKLQTDQAWKDWRKLALTALESGLTGEEIELLKPPYSATWKTIDKYIMRLREAIQLMEAAK
jgi:hypothetical protein